MKRLLWETYEHYLGRRSYFLSPTGCRICTIPTSRLGYCQMRYQYGRNGFSQAHRVAWENAHGPIPDGLHVLHKCDVRNCIEVDHLFLGTHQDNMDDKARKNRCNVPKGATHYKAKLTNEQVIAIRADTRTHLAIAAEYGVSASLIDKIWKRECWKHI